MKPLYTQEQFTNAKSEDKLPCECYICKSTFYKDKRTLNKVLNNVSGHTGQFCSHKCKILFIGKGKQEVQCLTCKIFFEKYLNQIKKHPKHFCSQSCAASYNNTHKTTGTRRSKLENFLEQELTSIYPNIKIYFNKKDTINSELDIYIPSLKLAFELNGIFHYEPIYGSDKLNQIKNNDHRKFQACAEKGISLCIIDTSKQKYFKESTSQEFLSIITDIINNISKNI